MKVGYYIPAYRGLSWDWTRATMLNDMLYAGQCGASVVDLNRLVNPQTSIEQARNLALQRAMANECTHLMMMDADVAAPDCSPLAELSDALVGHQATVAAAAVPIRYGRHRLNVSGNAAGAALMLVDLQELSKLDKPPDVPWFKRVYNSAITSTLIDEGVFFCVQVTEHYQESEV